MPRQPRPFFREQTQSWYVQLGKRQFPLGKDEEQALLRYHHLMAGRTEPGPSLTVSRLIDDFLSKRRSESAALIGQKVQRSGSRVSILTGWEVA